VTLGQLPDLLKLNTEAFPLFYRRLPHLHFIPRMTEDQRL